MAYVEHIPPRNDRTDLDTKIYRLAFVFFLLSVPVGLPLSVLVWAFLLGRL